jgi:hypothetical protein
MKTKKIQKNNKFRLDLGINPENQFINQNLKPLIPNKGGIIMKKIAIIMTIIATSLFVAGFAAAYQIKPIINYNPELHEKIEKAIEDGNYAEWKKIRQENNLPTNGRIFQIINEKNFQTFSELHKAIEKGDMEKALELKAKLGLNQPKYNWQQPGMCRKQGNGFGKRTMANTY